MLIPSHAKKVQPYRDELQIPLYHRYQVEGQLDAMHSAIVQLPSGGYIVINPTEALVAIDVNSGRSTKERNIEETALKTNLEAADEIARSLRLRDLAGLIVVDFIDMEISRNQAQVERRIKEAMKNDRARIQIGRISPFGLLELSRQRLRPSFTETSTETCHFCHGTGVRRSLESTVLHVLRVIEEEGIRRRSDEITVHVPTQVALYILNQKRDQLAGIEERYQMTVQLLGDDSLVSPEYKLERIKAKSAQEAGVRPLGPEDSTHLDEIRGEVLDSNDEEQDDDGRKRRRRRRPRRRKNEGQVSEEVSEDLEVAEPAEIETETDSDDDNDDDKPRKRRRRGKRGGRRRSRRPNEDDPDFDENESSQDDADADSSEDLQDAENNETETTSSDDTQEERTRRRPRRRGMRRRRNDDTPRETTDVSVVEATEENSPSKDDTAVAEAVDTEALSVEAEEEKPKRKPVRRRTTRKKKDEETAPTSSDESADTPVETPKSGDETSETEANAEAEKPKRKTTTRRRTTTTRKKKVETDGNETDASVSDAAPSEKPKRRTTRKAKTADTVKTEEPKAVVENKVETVAIAATGVIVKNSDGSQQEIADDKPKRKGWWSR